MRSTNIFKSFAPFSVLLSLLLTSYSGLSQDKILIHIPSAEDEAEYIWSTLQNIQFFEEHNYPVTLPKGEIIEELKEKSKQNTLTEIDLAYLKKFITDSVYNVLDYQKGYKNVDDIRRVLNGMIHVLHKADYPWGFKKYETYSIQLTLYGSGGGYNSDNGFITLYTDPIGGFKQYNDPTNTLIHEIIHLGIEESIILKYEVPHTLKERIVDQFVLLYFKEALPKYHLQEMGEDRIDSYLKVKEDLVTLNQFVEEILQTK